MSDLSLVFKRLPLYFLAGILLVLCASPFVLASQQNNSQETPIYILQRNIQYSFTLRNTTNQVLPRVEFWAYAPVKQTPTQQTLNLFTSHPHEMIEDELGNRIMLFVFIDLPPYASKNIHIKAGLALAEQPYEISDTSSTNFLESQRFVETNAEEIKRLAGKLQVDDPFQIAQKTFNWVAHNIQYTGYASNEKGALQTLKTREGDCTEYMDLFVALMRANKIPARGIAGYVVNEDAVLKPNGFHNWAEFKIDGVWLMADPQKKVFTSNQSDYIAMRIIGTSPDELFGDFGRFGFRGEGLLVEMNQ